MKEVETYLAWFCWESKLRCVGAYLFADGYLWDGVFTLTDDGIAKTQRPLVSLAQFMTHVNHLTWVCSKSSLFERLCKPV